ARSLLARAFAQGIAALEEPGHEVGAHPREEVRVGRAAAPRGRGRLDERTASPRGEHAREPDDAEARLEARVVLERLELAAVLLAGTEDPALDGTGAVQRAQWSAAGHEEFLGQLGAPDDRRDGTRDDGPGRGRESLEDGLERGGVLVGVAAEDAQGRGISEDRRESDGVGGDFVGAEA